MQGVGTKVGTVPDIFGGPLDQCALADATLVKWPELFRWLDPQGLVGGLPEEPLALFSPSELLGQVEREAVDRLLKGAVGHQKRDLEHLATLCRGARSLLARQADPAAREAALLLFFKVGRLAERARARAVETEVLKERHSKPKRKAAGKKGGDATAKGRRETIDGQAIRRGVQELMDSGARLMDARRRYHRKNPGLKFGTIRRFTEGLSKTVHGR